ncbi:hypothetical protein GQ53DRAFT_869876 [Thozetella sp. PMI_491]|nr:hypothetical protein GQ53DRAFT_869876 [Thozetella sp. PMI_491]
MYSLALLVGMFTGNVAATLAHPALWPDLNFLGGVINSLPAASVSISQWGSNEISQGCRARIIADGKNPTNFKQYSVKLGDCSLEWYICQENGSPTSIDTLATNFARVPVRMRQWVNNVVNYNSGGGAYAYGSDIAFYGADTTTGTMIHECTHTVDFGDGFYSMQSGDQEWLDAYNSDTAVPDNYARVNLIENLAQFPSLIIYDRWTNGQLQTHPELPAIGHQLQKVSDQSDWNSPYGGRILDPTTSGLTCTRRWALSAHVNPSTGASTGIATRNASVAAAASNIYIMPESEATPIKTECSITGL